MALDPIPRSGGGSNQARLRANNERLILSIVRRHRNISKSQLARQAGLTPQAVTIIARALERDELLQRGEPQRGRVGQPSVPMSLNPDGAYSVGLKIGRRRSEMVLMNFTGRQIKSLHAVYSFPDPQKILEFARTGYNELLSELSGKQLRRLAGLGIAMPFRLWDWEDNIGAPAKKMDAWRDFDIQTEIEAFCDYPVSVENDATSACGAELVFGRGTEFPDYVYFYIGSFIGGGVVLNRAVFRGKSGNAGAIGPMPVVNGSGRPSQLLEHASIYVLEKKLQETGIDPSPLWLSSDDWSAFEEPVTRWISTVAENLAIAIVSACSIIDFDAAIIDGSFPENVRRRIVEATLVEVKKLDLQGIDQPAVVAGNIDGDARVIGSASQPLFARYLLDHNVPFSD